MQLQLALLLSSTHQAEMFIPYEPLVSLHPHPRYRLLVSETPGQVYTLSIFHATYPDKAEGKGWGEPHFGAPHTVTPEAKSMEDFATFLAGYTLPTQDGWRPAEDEDKGV